MNNSKPKLIRITTVPVAMYKILKGQLSFLNQYFDVVGLCSHERYYEDLKKEENIRLIDVEIRREINIRKDILAVLKMVRIFRKEKPMIIHSHTPKAGLLAMLAGKIARVPIRIHTFTGLRFETATGSFRKLLILMDKITCSCATLIIPEGDGVKKTLLENKITRKPLHKILNGNINGINTSYYNRDAIKLKDCSVLRKELNLNPEDFVVCFIGRVTTDKGINELVEAFKILTRKSSSLKLIMVGPYERTLDPLKTSTYEIIDSNSSIITVGLQQDVRPYLAISKLFILPSYREGFPNVVLQAGAMGIPAIVTNISGCNEIIHDGVNGKIIPSHQVEPIVNTIWNLYTNPMELQYLTSNARSSIEKRFQQTEVWNALLDEYKKQLTKYNIKIG